jgi:hypothetical protein
LGGHPHLPERRRINQTQMPPHRLGKGLLRTLPVVIPHQFHVALFGHLTIYGRGTRNQAFIF